jgi:hypothetical protein
VPPRSGALLSTIAAGTPAQRIADVAQLVAHHLAKVRVAGSNPVIRSRVQRHQTPTVEWPSGEATACKAVHTGSIPVSTSKPARLAQRESASLTRKRSLVQSQYRALKVLVMANFAYTGSDQPATATRMWNAAPDPGRTPKLA